MYFLTTDFNEWDLKKAFLHYLQDNEFSEAKSCIKDDLIAYLKFPNLAKKAKSKAEIVLNNLNVSISSVFLINYYKVY